MGVSIQYFQCDEYDCTKKKNKILLPNKQALKTQEIKQRRLNIKKHYETERNLGT